MLDIRKFAFFCLAWSSIGGLASTQNIQTGELMYQLDDETNSATVLYPISKAAEMEYIIPSAITDEQGSEYTVTHIAANAFNNSAAYSISVPATVLNIGLNAFAKCEKLSSLRFEYGDLPLTLPQQIFDDNNSKCHSYTPMSFYGGRPLIHDFVLLKNTNVETCELYQLEVLNDKYLIDCTALKHVTLHEGLQSITHAFARCKSLQSLEIPEGVISVSLDTFDDCNSLTSLTLPSTITQIGPFYDNPLTDIYIYALTPPVTEDGNGPFKNSSSGYVHVLPEALEAYRASLWGKTSQYTIVGDLKGLSSTKSIAITAIGNGTLTICSVNGEDVDQTPQACNNTIVAELPDDAKIIQLRATPEANTEVASFHVSDVDGTTLPATISIQGSSLFADIAMNHSMKVESTFRQATANTLHICLPQAQDNMISLSIPSHSNYCFAYTPTHGYTLKQVLLEDEELPITGNPESGTVNITIPPLDADKTLRLIEESSGAVTTLPGNIDSSDIRVLSINGTIQLTGLTYGTPITIYDTNGIACLRDTAKHNFYTIPQSIKGLHLIVLPNKTLKVNL